MQPLNLPELPDTTELGQRENYLILKKRALQTAWNASPYYIEEVKSKSVVVDVQRYSDKYRPDLEQKRAPLSTFLKLAPAFFPTELLGQGYWGANTMYTILLLISPLVTP